jgi:hypothetical protein
MLADFIFIDSQGNFTCSFYNCTQNVVYTVTAKSFDDLEIVLPRPKRPRRQFFSRYVKERFRILDMQSVPELAYIPLTANVNIYSEMDSAKKIV